MGCEDEGDIRGRGITILILEEERMNSKRRIIFIL